MNFDSLLLSDVDDLQLTYTFSKQELRILARFIRLHQEQIPEGLEDFAGAVEKAMYDSMSIDEAEVFYS
ncbi:MAG: hypothetical protein IJP62_00635 [Treponema sp.]|nr:hypothetical protein [Treponema sp.]